MVYEQHGPTARDTAKEIAAVLGIHERNIQVGITAYAETLTMTHSQARRLLVLAKKATT